MAAIPGTKARVIDRPSNGLYSTVYAIELIGGDSPVVIGWTAAKTNTRVLNAIRKNSDAIIKMVNGSDKTTVKKRKGFICFDLEGCDPGYSVMITRTARELHGKTILELL